MPRHIFIKPAKIEYKEKILTAMEEQQVTYWEILMRLSAVFSSQTLKARMEWCDIFKKIKGATCNQEFSSQAELLACQLASLTSVLC